MAYQISRSRKIIETLELTDENGKTVHAIPVRVDADGIASQFRKNLVDILDAEKTLTEVTKGGAKVDEGAFERYNKALHDIFVLIFGEESTDVILAFFEKDSFEAASMVVPFLKEVIFPKIEQAIKARKRNLKQYYR